MSSNSSFDDLDEEIKPFARVRRKKSYTMKSGKKSKGQKSSANENDEVTRHKIEIQSPQAKADPEDVINDVKKLLESDSLVNLDFPSPFANGAIYKPPIHNSQTLKWPHRINLIGEKCPSPRIHMCEICTKPILIYGRMIPCKHVFCLVCAKINPLNCLRCDSRVLRIDRFGLGAIFMCSIDQCRRTYLSGKDLQAHVQHRHQQKAPKTHS